MPDPTCFTWREIVRDVLHHSRTGELTLAEIYEAVRGHPKTKTNSVWQAAIRRTLKFDPELERAERGIWRIRVLH
jgi:hypothetical protein